MALYTTVTAKIEAVLSSALDLSTPADRFTLETVKSLSTGTGADAADLLFHDTRSIPLSDSENLDLAGGLTSPLGATLTFARVKALYVKAAAGNTNNVILGAHATAAWAGPWGATGTHTLKPGDSILLVSSGATAWPVTATTADLLKVANSGAGTSVSYDIVIIGASA